MVYLNKPTDVKRYHELDIKGKISKVIKLEWENLSQPNIIVWYRFIKIGTVSLFFEVIYYYW